MAGSDLLLFLGAGASMPAPTRLPAFEPLTAKVLRELGWHWQTDEDRPTWRHLGYPDITPPWESGLPPEVVFRILDQLRIGFAGPVEALMTCVQPNAAHRVAAAILRAGGCVWTPNIDMAVERAWSSLCQTDGLPPRALGAVAHRSSGDSSERDFTDAGPGTLVKFHGSADIHGSLAFTDHQLLTPLPASQVTHLADLASGRHIAFYGYRGADADLHDLLASCIERASEVTCFVVDLEQRRAVEQAFPSTDVRFQPEHLEPARVHNLAPCAESFLALAEEHGLTPGIEESARVLLGEDPAEHGGIREPDFDFRPAALVHAQLVERFGDPARQLDAFRMARRTDVTHPINAGPRALLGHLHWMVTWSLYHEGIVAKLLRGSASALQHPVLKRMGGLPVVRRYREVVLDKATALLLLDGRWQDLLRLSDFAISARRTSEGEPRPDDLYYHGHALRYAGEVSRARTAQEKAETGLAGERWRRVDPERLAGSILEHGILDLYQGRFLEALRRAEDLKDYRGRYAIQRWASWGHWLAGTASIYRFDLKSAERELEVAAERFGSAKEEKHVNDVRTAQLLSLRVARALGRPSPTEPTIDWIGLTPRQRDDVRLVRADLALADGLAAEAADLVAPILAEPTNTMAALWAELVMAEVERRSGQGGERFDRVRTEANRRGARWLELQAVAGLIRAGSRDADEQGHALAATMQLDDPATVEELQRGDPPLLWAVT